jgi:hypothetical protein
MPYGASVGVAQWPADGPTKGELVRAADGALYEAKRRRGESPGDVEAGVQEDLAQEILEAAHDLLAARNLEEVAAAALRHGAAIVGSGEGLVAVGRKHAGNGRGRSGEEMDVVAGLGRLGESTERIRRGEGFWGRVWAGGSAMAEDQAGSGIVVGVPLASRGVAWGVLGFALGKQAAISPERMRMLDHLAVLAGAAARRHSRSTTKGGSRR